MFFILSKLFYFFLSPFIWIILLLIAFFLLEKWNNRKILLWISFALFVFFSNSVITSEAVRLWEKRTICKDSINKHEIGIVLGGMAEYDKNARRLSIRRGGDRIWQALNLYHSKKIKKILISGDNGYLTEKGLHEAKQFKNNLVLWNVPKQDILIETKSRNTYENSIYTHELLKNNKLHRSSLLLITSGIHMRRANASFKKAGLDCTEYPTDNYTSEQRSYTFENFFIPNIDNFNIWHNLIKEIVGYFFYFLMGYL